MPYSLCPSIKTYILGMRITISELENLKASLLRGDTECQDRFKVLQEEIEDWVRNIDRIVDGTANDNILRKIKESGKYAEVYHYSQGRSRVIDKNDKYFHISIDGEPIYSEQYEYVESYKKGIAYVNDGYPFYIDLDGNRLPDRID
jgi:hypothetical protein